MHNQLDKSSIIVLAAIVLFAIALVAMRNTLSTSSSPSPSVKTSMPSAGQPLSSLVTSSPTLLIEWCVPDSNIPIYEYHKTTTCRSQQWVISIDNADSCGLTRLFKLNITGIIRSSKLEDYKYAKKGDFPPEAELISRNVPWSIIVSPHGDVPPQWTMQLSYGSWVRVERVDGSWDVVMVMGVFTEAVGWIRENLLATP